MHNKCITFGTWHFECITSTTGHLVHNVEYRAHCASGQYFLPKASTQSAAAVAKVPPKKYNVQYMHRGCIASGGGAISHSRVGVGKGPALRICKDKHDNRELIANTRERRRHQLLMRYPWCSTRHTCLVEEPRSVTLSFSSALQSTVPHSTTFVTAQSARCGCPKSKLVPYHTSEGAPGEQSRWHIGVDAMHGLHRTLRDDVQ